MPATRSGARSTPTRPWPSAHYNLSFVLSQLGDFDGALRETRRALELEPLYVPQKFSLTIDLQYEDPTIAIAPELDAGGGRRSARRRSSRSSRRRWISCSRSWRPRCPPAAATGAGGDALDLARDYIAKGLLDLASAELSRAAARGAPHGATAVLLGDIFAKRGLYGEALERYRAARVSHAGRSRRDAGRDPRAPGARLGERRGAAGRRARAPGPGRRRGARGPGSRAAGGHRRAGCARLHP